MCVFNMEKATAANVSRPFVNANIFNTVSALHLFFLSVFTRTVD